MYHLVSALHPDRFSIFSHSLGDHSVHQLPFKLSSAACGGFLAVEISLIDLEDYAYSRNCELLEAAHEIEDLCQVLGLRVSCLQPFRDAVESKSTKDVVQRATRLFPIMDALNTELLVCCSSFLPKDQIDGSINTAINNLRAMGVAASNWRPNPKRIAFEALSWGTYINLWVQAWEVVEAVDLENVGICLDSFNTLAREWADPTAEGGILENAGENLKRSMSELSRLPGSKIFLLQIGDGARLNKPIEKETIEKPALMTWSRSSRLFPMEYDLGGYMPVTEFVQAVSKTGYNGYWSLEVFNESLKSKSPSTPMSHALRGFNSLSKLENFIFRDAEHIDTHTTHTHGASNNLSNKLNDIQITPYQNKSDCSLLDLSPTNSTSSEFNNQLIPDGEHASNLERFSDSKSCKNCETDAVPNLIVF